MTTAGRVEYHKSSSAHECGWCKAWSELMGWFDAGIREEAAMEALRMVRTGREGIFAYQPDCKTATMVLARMRQLGFAERAP